MMRWLAIATVILTSEAYLGVAAAQSVAEVPAAAPGAGDSQAQLAESDPVVRGALGWLDSYLLVPSEWPLPAELRRQGTALVAKHKPRLRAWLSRLRAELGSQIDADANVKPEQRERTLSWALLGRMQNELALTQLDSAGPAHEHWRRKTALAPGVCRYFYRGALWAETLLWMARLPEAEHAAALAHADELLSRWGQARPGVEARPAFSLDAFAQRWVERLQADSNGPRPPVAMVPVVAYRLLQDDAGPVAGNEQHPPPERGVRCAALQWALANALAEMPAEQAQIWSAFRHASIERAEDWAGRTWRQDPNWKPSNLASGDYPALAQRLEVTGTTRLRVKRDAQGRVTSAEVVARRLTMPGLAGQRPVFIETLLDEAALARVPLLPPGAAGSTEVELVWSLQ